MIQLVTRKQASHGAITYTFLPIIAIIVIKTPCDPIQERATEAHNLEKQQLTSGPPGLSFQWSHTQIDSVV